MHISEHALEASEITNSWISLGLQEQINLLNQDVFMICLQIGLLLTRKLLKATSL